MKKIKIIDTKESMRSTFGFLAVKCIDMSNTQYKMFGAEFEDFRYIANTDVYVIEGYYFVGRSCKEIEEFEEKDFQPTLEEIDLNSFYVFGNVFETISDLSNYTVFKAMDGYIKNDVAPYMFGDYLFKYARKVKPSEIKELSK